MGENIEKTHITMAFRGQSESGKTVVWDVNTKDGSMWLGAITWLGFWRCYVFTPAPDTLFEKTCLREIADFCEVLTTAHRLDAKRRRDEVKENAKKAATA